MEETCFMHFSRTRVEALESFLTWLVGLIVNEEFARFLAFFYNRLLATDEADGKAFWVRYS